MLVSYLSLSQKQSISLLKKSEKVTVRLNSKVIEHMGPGFTQDLNYSDQDPSELDQLLQSPMSVIPYF